MNLHNQPASRCFSLHQWKHFINESIHQVLSRPVMADSETSLPSDPSMTLDSHDWCFELLHGRLLTLVHENRDLCCGDHDHGISLRRISLHLAQPIFPFAFLFLSASHAAPSPVSSAWCFPLPLLHDFPCLMKIRFLPCLCLFHQLLFHQYPQLPLLEDSNLVRKRSWSTIEESYAALPLQKHMLLSSSSSALLQQQRAQHGTAHHYCEHCRQNAHVSSAWHPHAPCWIEEKKPSNKKNFQTEKTKRRRRKFEMVRSS